jgi:hypothetical protein
MPLTKAGDVGAGDGSEGDRAVDQQPLEADQPRHPLLVEFDAQCRSLREEFGDITRCFT